MTAAEAARLRGGAWPRRDVAVLVCLFVGSRVLLRLLGFHFEVGMLVIAVQNIDPALLRAHLLQSLWYLHGQPPLWNALLGIALKVAPTHWPQLWHLAFLALGLVLVLALYGLLRELDLPRGAAVALAAAFSLTPAVLLYENFFFYDYPTLVAVTLTALAVARFARIPSFGRGSAVFALLAYSVLTRTLFQVWWIVLVAAILLVATGARRRLVMVAAALPVALVLGVYVKNWVLFGVPSTSSWTGMGLARVAVDALPLAERQQLVREGKLNAVALVQPLAPLPQYEAVGIRPDRPTGIPLLDEVSGPKVPRNLENKTYIRISRLYLTDDLWIIEHRPLAYLRAVGRGLDDFFTSPTVAWDGQGNEADIARYDDWFTRLVYGRLGPGRVGLFLVAAYCLAIGFGLVHSVQRLRPGCDAVTTTVAFMTMTIVYVLLVGNVAEVGENFRFRLVVDPLALALCAVAAHRLVRTLRRSAS
jgi:hypothetical protein